VKRTFTFEEAKKLLPAVRERTRRALGKIEALEEEGTRADGPEAEGILSAWAREMEELGIDVKGAWLVDFDSGDGYWCWRWPEETLDYYHGYDEGFAGRVRIQ
jgi:hypothetical protein